MKIPKHRVAANRVAASRVAASRVAASRVAASRAGPVRLALLVTVLATTGCGAERPYSEVRMTHGTATYQVTAAGVSVAGSFTLVVGFPDADLDHGNESEVYLHRLQLLEGYAFEIDEMKPEIEEVTSDRPMPFVAQAGNQTRATFHWSIDRASTLPSALCDARLISQVYLSLTDELAEIFLDEDDHWYPDQRLVWSPDPCQH